MAESQKKSSSDVNSKEKNDMLDLDIGKDDFLSSWKPEGDTLDLDFGPVSKGNKKPYQFDKSNCATPPSLSVDTKKKTAQRNRVHTPLAANPVTKNTAAEESSKTPNSLGSKLSSLKLGLPMPQNLLNVKSAGNISQKGSSRSSQLSSPDFAVSQKYSTSTSSVKGKALVEHNRDTTVVYPSKHISQSLIENRNFAEQEIKLIEKKIMEAEEAISTTMSILKETHGEKYKEFKNILVPNFEKGKIIDHINKAKVELSVLIFRKESSCYIGAVIEMNHDHVHVFIRTSSKTVFKEKHIINLEVTPIGSNSFDLKNSQGKIFKFKVVATRDRDYFVRLLSSFQTSVLRGEGIISPNCTIGLLNASCDASTRDDGECSIGVVVTNEEGEYVTGACGVVEAPGSTQAEVVGLLQLLQELKRYYAWFLVTYWIIGPVPLLCARMQLDSESIFDQLKLVLDDPSRKVPNPNFVMEILYKCRDILRDMHWFEIEIVCREINGLAHTMASLGFAYKNVQVLSQAPEELISILIKSKCIAKLHHVPIVQKRAPLVGGTHFVSGGVIPSNSIGHLLRNILHPRVDCKLDNIGVTSAEVRNRYSAFHRVTKRDLHGNAISRTSRYGSSGHLVYGGNWDTLWGRVGDTQMSKWGLIRRASYGSHDELKHYKQSKCKGAVSGRIVMTNKMNRLWNAACLIIKRCK